MDPSQQTKTSIIFSSPQMSFLKKVIDLYVHIVNTNVIKKKYCDFFVKNERLTHQNGEFRLRNILQQ